MSPNKRHLITILVSLIGTGLRQSLWIYALFLCSVAGGVGQAIAATVRVGEESPGSIG